MPTRRTPAPCACGARYDEFRTGLRFADVRGMLWDVEDPSRPGWWRQKRRRCVLGFWRELKIAMFYVTHGGCSEALGELEGSIGHADQTRRADCPF